MLTASRYNFFVDRLDGVVAYNARTGVFAHMSRETADVLRSDNFAASEEDVDALVSMGFLHYGDELSLVLKKLAPQSLPKLGIVLAPTIGCNRTCSYCYQNEYRSASSMSGEVQRATTRFIRKEIASRNAKTVSLTWFGGEPLLEKEIVYRLTREIAAISCELGVTMEAPELITNGDYLDLSCQGTLAELGFSHIQISVDSLIDDGFSKRGVFTQDGRYSKLIEHAMAAQARFDVNIRINVTKKTAACLPEILSALKECGLGDVASINRAEDVDGEAGAITLQTGARVTATNNFIPISQLIDPNTVSRKQFATLKLGVEEKKSDSFLRFIENELTPTVGSYCGATEGRMLVIDPKGNVSRCWNSAGVDSEAIGNVLESDESFAAEKMWSSYGPGSYESCATCKVLPLCKGGCSHPRLFAASKYPPCTDIKYNVDSYVEFIGSRLAWNNEGPES
jgi:uncharacterized protein